MELSLCGLGPVGFQRGFGWCVEFICDRTVELVDEYVEEFSVACHFENVEDGFEWAFVGVYGPNLDSSRSLWWDELFVVAAIFLGVLEGTSPLLDLLLIAWENLISLQRWLIFLISFSSWILMICL